MTDAGELHQAEIENLPTSAIMDVLRRRTHLVCKN